MSKSDIAYGVTATGEGNVFINPKTHTSLSVGGGQPGQGYPCVMAKTVFENHSQDSRYKELGEVCQSVSATFGMGGNNQPFVLESNQNHATITNNGITTTLPASMGEGGGYVPMIKEESNMVVRRLTPLECERLRGFPDGWTDIGEWTDTKGKLHKAADSPRYKALGNSIAVGYTNNQSGFWMCLMKRISAQYERSATLDSLFDGIGGFPLAWEFYNGKGSALWASEIEEFPIAVTKKRFPEEEGEKDE